MTDTIFTFITEYNREKMITTYEPLESLKKMLKTDLEEARIASLTYRLGIVNFDEKVFEKALTTVNFNVPLDEKHDAENGIQISLRDILKVLSMDINLKVADYYDLKVKELFSNNI